MLNIANNNGKRKTRLLKLIHRVEQYSKYYSNIVFICVPEPPQAAPFPYFASTVLHIHKAAHSSFHASHSPLFLYRERESFVEFKFNQIT